LELVAFSNKTVNNLLPDPRPRITNAQTNLSGDSVILQLDKKMQSPGAYKSQFQLFKNSVNSNSISAISLKNNDSSVFILTLNSKVFYEDILTITYSGSSVKSNDGYALQTVSLLPVTNISAGYPPLITSAVIRKNNASWNIITLKFDRQLANVNTQKKFFSVHINSQLTTIDTLKGNSDSIQFIIIPAMKYTDNVKISYSGGSVASVNNGLLAGFTDYTVSNSIPLSDNTTDIKQNETITIYPNPLKNELKVKSKIEFNTLNIYSLDGKSVLEKHYQGSINNTSLELNLNKGIYIIRISNIAASYDTKIIVE
jgi:hypothetical protein